jgi:hypothetical protein
MALVVEITLRTTAGRHYHRTGKFQFLLSNNNRSAVVIILVGTAVVVVPEVIGLLF